jgi:hypothetical protein
MMQKAIDTTANELIIDCLNTLWALGMVAAHLMF